MELRSDSELPGESPEPGVSNYLVYCDESGIDGQRYYGFGSLWMPWHRRPEFCEALRTLCVTHSYRHEVKWNRIARQTEAFYRDIVELFFRKSWMAFHALVVRKGYTDTSFHPSFDIEKRKRFVMLLKSKIQKFCRATKPKAYHVRVDPLPSSYAKADEAALKIVAASLKKDLGLTPLKSLITRDSRSAPGIQVSDLLLGAVMSEWQGTVTSLAKLNVRASVAECLGWPDLHADTHPSEKKFNIWYFYSDTDDKPREIETRPVQLKHRMPWQR